MQKYNVSMNMLGAYSIEVAGKNILENKENLLTSICWRMFCLLAVHQGEWLTEKQIAEKMEIKPVGDNGVERAVANLRRELESQLGVPGDELVLKQDTRYCLAENIQIWADFLLFKDICMKLSACRNHDADKRFALYCKLVELYRGDMLLEADAPEWLQDYSLALQTEFLERMGECCEMLWKARKYQNIMKIYESVEQVRPPCDELTVYWYRAMLALNLHARIAKCYEQTARLFRQRGEKDSPVLFEIECICQQSALRSVKSVDLLEQFKGQLVAPASGKAKVCYYNDLVSHCCRFPGRYAVAVFTLQLKQVENALEPAEKLLSVAMRTMQDIAEENLRSHDMITPYSENQLIIAMPNHSEQGGKVVKNRLCQAFEQHNLSKNIALEAEVAVV